MKGRQSRFNAVIPAIAALATVLALIPAGPASAHFKLNLNVRILHVEHLQDGFRVYFRTPMPYLVADRVGPDGSDGLPEPAPYTRNAFDGDQVVHYLDLAQLAANPIGLGEFAGQGLRFDVGNYRPATSIENIKVYRIGTQPDFSTLEAAKSAFAGHPQIPDSTEPIFVGDTIVDVVLHYSTGQAVRNYRLSSTLDPGLPDQDETANLLLDYRPGGPRIYRARGLLKDPIEISHSVFSSLQTFVKEGFRHILVGADHVIFVLCMVLGAGYLGSLVWRVTGFTIGHSITLSMGFFGFVPKGEWFIPLVEAGIALSIIYIAIVAMRPINDKAGYDRNMFLVTSAIGLLHGLGFSFVLHKILQITSPDIWKSLFAFNLGIELGQLLIVLLTWPVVLVVRARFERVWKYSRNGIALASVLAASMWTFQRLSLLFS